MFDSNLPKDTNHDYIKSVFANKNLKKEDQGPVL